MTLIAFSAIKLAAELLILFTINTGELLRCMGDAVLSFFAWEDMSTAGICLTGKQEIKQSVNLRRGFAQNPLKYSRKRGRWWCAINKTRWAYFITMSVLSISS